MLSCYRFENPSIASDACCPKTGKILYYKQYNVNASSEVEARQRAARPKLDSDRLSLEYRLIGTYPLSAHWQTQE